MTSFLAFEVVRIMIGICFKAFSSLKSAFMETEQLNIAEVLISLIISKWSSFLDEIIRTSKSKENLLDQIKIGFGDLLGKGFLVERLKKKPITISEVKVSATAMLLARQTVIHEPKEELDVSNILNILIKASFKSIRIKIQSYKNQNSNYYEYIDVFSQFAFELSEKDNEDLYAAFYNQIQDDIKLVENNTL